MRRSQRFFTFCLVLLTACSLRAQDVHYTLHDYAPLWLNPANTGAFSGSIRAGGIYRGQWYSLNGIQSPTLYADAPLGFALRKQDWIGVGLSMVNDQAGELGITQNFFGFSGAYHLSLDKKRQNIITLGVQYGSISYGFNAEQQPVQQRTIEEALGGGGQDGELMLTNPNQMGGNDNQSVNDLNVGLKAKILLDAKKNNVFEAGVSFLHLTNPERRSLIQTVRDTMMNPDPTPPVDAGRDSRRRKGTIHANARLDLEMSEKWRFQPSVFFQNSASSSSVSLQAWGQRALKKDLNLRLGLGYRTSDAAKVLV
ncbi:MAG: PorP/SprF family type IX secretion system membrane protein, partial [Bacteroidota bacterium]